MSAYQPKTGAPCGCRPGQWRDNCLNCEGTGRAIDFAAIRARNGVLPAPRELSPAQIARFLKSR